MNESVNIVLVLRTGGDFSMSDVLLLANQLYSVNGDLQVNVYCLTDVVSSSIELKTVTLMPLSNKWNGWWAKMNLFSPELMDLRPFLYLDLDTVVLESLSSIIPNEVYRKGLIMLRDFYQMKVPASGIMWIPSDEENEKVAKVWMKWIANAKIHMRRYRGDQQFIGSVVQPDYFWQDIIDGIVSFKPNRKYLSALTGEENIICFHGKPRIWEAAKSVKWVNDYIKINV